MASWQESKDEQKNINRLNAIIVKHRVKPGLTAILPRLVIPDTANRVNTGLSPVHVHYLATQMQLNGFIKRDNKTGQGHDIPVVVRETTDTELGAESLRKWRNTCDETEQFPPVLPSMHEGFFFTSLGNGHFFQALNLFNMKSESMFASILAGGDVGEQLATSPSKKDGVDADIAPAFYAVGADENLQDALTLGVAGIVLNSDISKADRKFVSLMLNNLFEYPWTMGADGSVMIDRSVSRVATPFEVVSKKADAYELEEILKLRLTIQARRKRDKKSRKRRDEDARHLREAASANLRSRQVKSQGTSATSDVPSARRAML
jgi:hypothetical protein